MSDTPEGQILDPPAEPATEGADAAAESTPAAPEMVPKERFDELRRELEEARSNMNALVGQVQQRLAQPLNSTPTSQDPNEQWWDRYIGGKASPLVQQAVAPVQAAAQQALLIASRAEAKEEMDEKYGTGAYAAYRKEVEQEQTRLAQAGTLLHARDVFKYVVGNDGGARLPKKESGKAQQAARQRAAANAATDTATPVGKAAQGSAKAMKEMSLDDMVREWGDQTF